MEQHQRFGQLKEDDEGFEGRQSLLLHREPKMDVNRSQSKQPNYA